MWLLAVMMALSSPVRALEVTVTSHPPLPAANLLANADIEQGPNDQPASWRWGTATPENFVTGWADTGRSGKCLYIKSLSPVMSGYWNQTVKVKPQTEYMLTGWFRLNGGKLLCYVNSRTADQRTLDERFYAVSMRNSPLVPVFLKPEYTKGYVEVERWHPFRIPFTPVEKMEWVSVSAGMYFQAGEVWYDDFRLLPAKTELKLQVKAGDEGLGRVRVLAKGVEQPVFDSGPLAGGTNSFEKTLLGLSTEAQYLIEATDSAGAKQVKAYPEEVAR